MAQSSGIPSSNPPRLHRLKNRSVQIALIGLLLSLAALGFLWNREFRGTGWGQIINPVYWWHRARGEDLYLPDQAFLMHGNHALPEITLTFDDGPHAESRAQILDTLKRYQIHATFFDVGRRMDEHPELVLRSLAEGHEIANHSANHLRLDRLTPEKRHREINDVDISYFRITGKHLTLMRPPGMRYDDQVLADTKRLGYVVVGYTTASGDYDTMASSEVIAGRTLRRVENGGILLLHDYPGTAAALPEIIEGLQKQGFRFVTVSEMLAHLPDKARQPYEAFLKSQSM